MQRTSIPMGKNIFAFTVLVLVIIIGAGISASAQTLEWLNSNVTVPSRVTATPNDQVLTTLKGYVHPLAQAKYDQGQVNDNLPMQHLILMLQRSPEQEQMLSAVIDGLHNRRSPLYHHWLTPARFANHFGPSSHDIGVVAQWLQSHGFKIDEIPAGHTAIIFSGTAAQVREAFHTAIHNLNVDGERHIANMTNPQIPTALTPVVAGLRSLNDFFAKPMMEKTSLFHRDAKTGKLQQVSGTKPLPQIVKQAKKSGGLFTDTADAFFLEGPQDFYVIYNENPLLTASTPINGAGSTIAVLEETDVVPADTTSFRAAFALPTYPTPPNSTAGGINYLFGANGVFCSDPGVLTDGEESEADLDVQWAGVSAPAAIIDFVSCASTSTSQGIDLSAMYVINDLSSTVSSMSLSYGGCEWFGQLPAVQFFTAMWQQAAAQGQTVVIASGDGGSMLCDTGSNGASNPTSVNFIASTPYNVAAGGTDFGDAYISDQYSLGAGNIWWNTTQSTSANGYESALSYVPEVSWGGEFSNPLTASYLQENAVTIWGTTYTPEAISNVDYNTVGDGLEEVIGGGGGVSSYVSIPTWQSAYGVGLTTNNTSSFARNVPDVALFASNGWWGHALPFCESDITVGGTCDFDGSFIAGDFPAAGGTSFVAPQVNGIIGLIVQQTGGAFQGNANYNFYNLATTEYGTPSNPNTTNLAACSGSGQGAAVGSTCLFYDIANDTPCLPGGTTACNTGGTTITSDIVEDCIIANYASYPAQSQTCFTQTAGDTLGLSSVSNSAFVDAYPTSQGYDAATGLGSMNIANMVGMWNSASTLFPTTTTLVANPASISPAGSTVLTATVTATGRGGFVAPLGTITFTDTTTGATLGTAVLSPTCGGTPPLCTGPSTASLTVAGSALAVGANSIIASFPGDAANDAPSTSAPAEVDVTTLAPVSVALTVSPTSAIVGQTITMTATVTGSGGTPTGTVTFLDGTTTLGTATLISGTATFMTNSLAVGAHAITAQYSGDATFAAGVSASVAVSITLAPSSTAISPLSTQVAPGQSVTLTATVSSSYTGASPTGTVTFVDTSSSGTTTLGTSAVSGGTATLSTSAFASGGNAIVAQYSGDSTFAASTSTAASVTVTSTVTTGQPVLMVTVPGAPINITAGQSAMATFSISVAPSGTTVGPVALTCSVATVVGNNPPPPTCTLSTNSLMSVTSTATNVTATISTTSASARLRKLHGSALATFALLLPGLLLVPAGSKRLRRRVLWLLAAMALLMAFTMMGCGGTNSAPYSVTVTASANGAVSDTATLAIQVHN